MPKLSLVAAEAERLLGRMHESRRLALQQDVAEMCVAYWHELRGRQPANPLAHALWAATPPLADLFVDLYMTGDKRLDDLLQGHRPSWGLALLALAEIEHGDPEGARLAHELMMVFESEQAGRQFAAHVAALLHGRLEPEPLHKHSPQMPLWKAIVVIVGQARRCDLKAIVAVIRLLADTAASDPALNALRDALDEVGIRFLGIVDDHIQYTQHGHAHKPASIKQLADSVSEIRQTLLA
jgi:hypothetical protein